MNNKLKVSKIQIEFCEAFLKIKNDTNMNIVLEDINGDGFFVAERSLLLVDHEVKLDQYSLEFWV